MHLLGPGFLMLVQEPIHNAGFDPRIFNARSGACLFNDSPGARSFFGD